jgi:hypothetical protein
MRVRVRVKVRENGGALEEPGRRVLCNKKEGEAYGDSGILCKFGIGGVYLGRLMELLRE